MHIFSSVYFIPRWRHTEKVHFIQELLKWQEGYDILNGQKCQILNFGCKETFPFSQIKVLLKSSFHLNVGTLGLNSPNKCSIVVVGGKYLEQVDEVMRMVDKITEDIAWMPSAVFLISRYEMSRHVAQLHLHPPHEGQWGGG